MKIYLYCNYPPVEPTALRLLAPQRGLLQPKNKTNTMVRTRIMGSPIRNRGEAHSQKRQTHAASPAGPDDLPAE
jgi:hypothetical protein